MCRPTTTVSSLLICKDSASMEATLTMACTVYFSKKRYKMKQAKSDKRRLRKEATALGLSVKDHALYSSYSFSVSVSNQCCISVIY